MDSLYEFLQLLDETNLKEIAHFIIMEKEVDEEEAMSLGMRGKKSKITK
jgi:hypothetical protein